MNAYIQLEENGQVTRWVYHDESFVPFMPIEDIPGGSHDLDVWKRHAMQLESMLNLLVPVTITDHFIEAYFR